MNFLKNIKFSKKLEKVATHLSTNAKKNNLAKSSPLKSLDLEIKR